MAGPVQLPGRPFHHPKTPKSSGKALFHAET
jgi:hypothetical protein